MKYRYAKTEDGTVIDVLTLNSHRRHALAPYICVGCGTELVPVLPTTKIVNHFKHKSTQQCSEETYLHSLAKNAFYNEYRHCLDENIPFYLELNTPAKCSHYQESLGITCATEKTVNHDLTKVFDSVELEKQKDAFQPDVRLYSSSSDAQMFVEIAVTHSCEQEKIKSGIRILEITIETESDITSIFRRKISEDSSNVAIYNIRKKFIEGDLCDGMCDKRVHVLKTDSLDKQLDVVRMKPDKIQPDSGCAVVGFISKNAYVNERQLVEKIRELRYSGYKLKNCYLCQHHAFSTMKWVFCSMKREVLNRDEAGACPQYYECESHAACHQAERKNFRYYKDNNSARWAHTGAGYGEFKI